jgi:hypothetical protein
MPSTAWAAYGRRAADAAGADGLRGRAATRVGLGHTSHERKSIERFVHELDEGVAQSGRAFKPTWRALVAPAYRRRLGRGLARL